MDKRRITQGERWQIIAHIKEGTKSNREIAMLIGVSEKCVRTTKQNFLHTGGASEKTRPGRPCQPPERTIVPFLELSELIQELVTKN